MHELRPAGIRRRAELQEPQGVRGPEPQAAVRNQSHPSMLGRDESLHQERSRDGHARECARLVRSMTRVRAIEASIMLRLPRRHAAAPPRARSACVAPRRIPLQVTDKAVCVLLARNWRRPSKRKREPFRRRERTSKPVPRASRINTKRCSKRARKPKLTQNKVAAWQCRCYWPK